MIALSRKVFSLSWIGIWQEKYLCWDFFTRSDGGSRCVLSPSIWNTKIFISNKISFWSCLVTPLPQLVLSMDCDWIIRKCLAPLGIWRESSWSLLYQAFVGTLQGNLYFKLEVFDDLLCVCAFSDFNWPLATCRNKLNATATRIYK